MSTPKLIDPSRSYVAGRWVEGDAAFAVENPADESMVAEVSATPLAEVERAVGEARRAFDEGSWADLRPTERAERVHALLDHLTTMKDDLVHTMVLEAGQPLGFAEGSQFGMGMGLARSTVDLYLSLPDEDAEPDPRRRVGPGPRRPERPAVRAGRRRRRHHAVQRSADHGLPEGRPRPPGRQLGDPAPEPAHPDLVARLRRRRRRRRHPARRPQRRGRGGGRGRRDCSRPTPPSTWCRSPGRRTSGAGSSPRRHRR